MLPEVHASTLFLAKESCHDLDPQGCAVNPSICQDPVLSVATCPRTCNKCGKSQYIISVNIL